jgi:hypothetical protein
MTLNNLKLKCLPDSVSAQKKGRPSGRPCIALDCCAPDMHPCMMETSLQLALPAPHKRVITSLSASLLKINIRQHPNIVKQIIDIFNIHTILYFFYNIYSYLEFSSIFKNLKNIRYLSRKSACQGARVRGVTR